MAHTASTSHSFVSLSRGFKRLNLHDPVTQCLAPRLSRSYATVTDGPTVTTKPTSAATARAPSSLISQSSAQHEPPSAARFHPDVLVTHYSWPTLEPRGFHSYKYHDLGLPTRRDILHRAVIWEADATRQGTANTKHRTEVKGSSKKVRPQKGTGRARLSDIRAPHIKGGGVVFGPKPRDFSTELPSKIYDLAFRTALSYRYKKGELIVLDDQVWLDEQLGPRWLSNFFETQGWGKGNGRTLMIADRPLSNDDIYIKPDNFDTNGSRWAAQIKAEQEHMLATMEQVGEHAELQYVEDVDVKDLLSCGRIVVEKNALRNMLQQDPRDVFLTARANKWRGVGSSPIV